MIFAGMKTLLSYFRAVRGGAAWVGQGFVMFWRVVKFEFVPTEKNLLMSLWYAFVHYKHVKPGATVHEFLDSRIVFYKRIMEDPDQRPKKRQMSRDLVNALYERSIRSEIIIFLQTPAPEKGYQAVIERIYGAWRVDKGETVAADGEGRVGNDIGGEKGSDKEAKKRIYREAWSERETKGTSFSAKTYVIAAQIHHEQAGRQEEFGRLCKEKGGLEKFVKQQFGVQHLPGTFEKFKRFDYTQILKGTNESKKGQLRPCFRQMMEHPEVFGSAVASRAGHIFEKYFD
jgi:hypothetical protein